MLFLFTLQTGVDERRCQHQQQKQKQHTHTSATGINFAPARHSWNFWRQAREDKCRKLVGVVPSVPFARSVTMATVAPTRPLWRPNVATFSTEVVLR